VIIIFIWIDITHSKIYRRLFIFINIIIFLNIIKLQISHVENSKQLFKIIYSLDMVIYVSY